MTRRTNPRNRGPSTPSRPFTLVVCRAGCDAPQAAAVLERLRDAVRSCPHGVLVTTGCLGGILQCDALTPHRSSVRGIFAVVQPCDTRRRPTGRPTRLGPLTDHTDATAVSRWLRAGLPDDGSLPRRLLASPPARAVAGLN
ncbi:hypothetical protein [Streptomyces sp. RPT161]|uniref:hypothetical protein n=1 Tax=Streptomyces sp. RPT161 TaxID=3015993 RepID=UPI0022B865A5|nr:hypothetical protein [Streptomyces sp. RPT161]